MLKSNSPHSPVRIFVFWSLALACAVGLFVLVRHLTTCWQLTSLPGLSPASCANQKVPSLETPVFVTTQATAIPTSTPEAAVPEDIAYPTWDGGSRINILFVGLRGGDPLEADCPFCTDTLILLTVDPITKTAGMLSIPRDMWVNIPGFGFSRINTAWSWARIQTAWWRSGVNDENRLPLYRCTCGLLRAGGF